MNTARATGRRHPETAPYPNIPVIVRVGMDELLGHYLTIAQDTYYRLRATPKDERQEYHESLTRYWKNVASGLRWVKKQNLRTVKANAAKPESSTAPTV